MAVLLGANATLAWLFRPPQPAARRRATFARPSGKLLFESRRLARDVELKVRYYHLALAREADQVDGAGIFWRARIVGRDGTVADLDGAVPMAERHVVGAGRRDLVITDEPAGTQPRAAIGMRLIVPVRHRDLPAREPWPRGLERDHVGIVAVGAPPDFQTE